MNHDEIRCPECNKLLMRELKIKCPRCKELVNLEGEVRIVDHACHAHEDEK